MKQEMEEYKQNLMVKVELVKQGKVRKVVIKKLKPETAGGI